MPALSKEKQTPPTNPNSSDYIDIDEIGATLIAGESIAKTPTRLPSATAQLPTLRPSATLLPTPTSFKLVIPKPSAVPVCDYARFVADVNIPDGTHFPPGARFVKTWRIKNYGTCSWTADYALIFDSGAMMGGSSINLGKTVKPGETIEISVTLTAPGQPGTHRGYWKIRNTKGIAFPSRFYVEISVTEDDPPPHDPRIRYDFAERICDAVWVNDSSTLLPCPGVEGDQRGFALQVPRPVLETGYIDNEPALLTHPPLKENSGIVGWYPSIHINPGDTFQTIIGCERYANQCNVRFQLSYVTESGKTGTLGEWDEHYNDAFTRLTVDLNPLAGEDVYFFLALHSNGDASGDRALWLRPRIQGP
jgi:hypothetical protein